MRRDTNPTLNRPLRNPRDNGLVQLGIISVIILICMHSIQFSLCVTASARSSEISFAIYIVWSSIYIDLRLEAISGNGGLGGVVVTNREGGGGNYLCQKLLVQWKATWEETCCGELFYGRGDGH